MQGKTGETSSRSAESAQNPQKHFMDRDNIRNEFKPRDARFSSRNAHFTRSVPKPRSIFPVLPLRAAILVSIFPCLATAPKGVLPAVRVDFETFRPKTEAVHPQFCFGVEKRTEDLHIKIPPFHSGREAE